MLNLKNCAVNFISKTMLKEKRQSKYSWDYESDNMLIQQISVHGPRQWQLIAEKLKPSNAKQCRERWRNQLNPFRRRGRWATEERLVLFILKNFC